MVVVIKVMMVMVVVVMVVDSDHGDDGGEEWWDKFLIVALLEYAESLILFTKICAFGPSYRKQAPRVPVARSRRFPSRPFLAFPSHPFPPIPERGFLADQFRSQLREKQWGAANSQHSWRQSTSKKLCPWPSQQKAAASTARGRLISSDCLQ